MNIFKQGAFDLSGTPGDDVLGVTNGGGASLFGREGDDILYFTGSIGEIYGGPGNDVLIGGGDIVEEWGGRGNDILVGHGSLNNLFGGPGHDKFVLNATVSTQINDYQRGIDKLVVPQGTIVGISGHSGTLSLDGDLYAVLNAPALQHDLIFA